MAEIRLERIRKTFGGVEVVKELDLVVPDSAFFTIVGPSGCGKSTILNMIAGLEHPSGGMVCFDGAPVNHLSPGDRDAAMVFQNYALYPHMSAYDNIAFPLAVRKVSRDRIREAVREISASLGLQGLLERKPKELSGGQRQRVALGRALIRRPKVFLMDEPLSNLDARLRIEMRAELKRLHEQFRITTVYVTHDQEEAMVLSDRIGVLHAGRLQQCGSPLEVYEAPANSFVAGFIGSPPMNMLEAERLAARPFLASVFEDRRAEDLLAGVRPCDVVVRTGEDLAGITTNVILLEPTGAELWVTGFWNGARIKGRAAAGESPEEGKPASFCFEPRKLHLFEKSTGLRIPGR
jgi:multiple sugar transport system ATP-binding protein